MSNNHNFNHNPHPQACPSSQKPAPSSPHSSSSRPNTQQAHLLHSPLPPASATSPAPPYKAGRYLTLIPRWIIASAKQRSAVSFPRGMGDEWMCVRCGISLGFSNWSCCIAVFLGSWGRQIRCRCGFGTWWGVSWGVIVGWSGVEGRGSYRCVTH